jgi:hypothetical protein
MNGRSLAIAVLPLLACGNGASSQTKTCGANMAGYAPAIDPTEFSANIANSYLNYAPGTVAKYVQSSGDVVETDVTMDTKVVMGVTCRVVHDFLKSASGQLLEDTYDYYAQDKAGNVWYFGEDTKAYAGNQVSTEGSWLAGVSCARPGMVMTANPRVGDKYRQEYLEGEAEDEAEVVSLAEKITVPYGTLESCIETKETSRLAPGDVENKYYCPGVFGPVSSVDIGTVDAGKHEDLVTVNGKMAGP